MTRWSTKGRLGGGGKDALVQGKGHRGKEGWRGIAVRTTDRYDPGDLKREYTVVSVGYEVTTPLTVDVVTAIGEGGAYTTRELYLPCNAALGPEVQH